MIRSIAMTRTLVAGDAPEGSGSLLLAAGATVAAVGVMLLVFGPRKVRPNRRRRGVRRNTRKALVAMWVVKDGVATHFKNITGRKQFVDCVKEISKLPVDSIQARSGWLELKEVGCHHTVGCDVWVGKSMVHVDPVAQRGFTGSLPE